MSTMLIWQAEEEEARRTAEKRLDKSNHRPNASWMEMQDRKRHQLLLLTQARNAESLIFTFTFVPARAGVNLVRLSK